MREFHCEQFVYANYSENFELNIAQCRVHRWRPRIRGDEHLTIEIFKELNCALNAVPRGVEEELLLIKIQP
jgi:hypothetical protein